MCHHLDFQYEGKFHEQVYQKSFLLQFFKPYFAWTRPIRYYNMKESCGKRKILRLLNRNFYACYICVNHIKNVM